MAELVPRYLDNDAIAVIEGDGAVSQELIAQGFDRLLFTGGTEIGRKVYEGAAPHLTPVTLELGGKSPVIVAADADIDVAAKRIAWTKLINSGQICIAPDYVLADAQHPRRARRQDQGRGHDIRGRGRRRQAHRQPAPFRPADQLPWPRPRATVAIGGGSDAASPADPADRRRRPGSRRAADDRRDLRTDPAGA